MRAMRGGRAEIRLRTLVHVKLPSGAWLAGWFEPGAGRRPARLHVNMNAALEVLGAEAEDLVPVVTEELVLRLPARSVLRLTPPAR